MILNQITHFKHWKIKTAEQWTSCTDYNIHIFLNLDSKMILIELYTYILIWSVIILHLRNFTFLWAIKLNLQLLGRRWITNYMLFSEVEKIESHFSFRLNLRFIFIWNLRRCFFFQSKLKWKRKIDYICQRIKKTTFLKHRRRFKRILALWIVNCGDGCNFLFIFLTEHRCRLQMKRILLRK